MLHYEQWHCIATCDPFVLFGAMCPCRLRTIIAPRSRFAEASRCEAPLSRLDTAMREIQESAKDYVKPGRHRKIGDKGKR